MGFDYRYLDHINSEASIGYIAEVKESSLIISMVSGFLYVDGKYILDRGLIKIGEGFASFGKTIQLDKFSFELADLEYGEFSNFCVLPKVGDMIVFLDGNITSIEVPKKCLGKPITLKIAD